MMKLSDRDIKDIGWELLIHKYLYYVINDPILDDTEYDILEKMWERATGKEMPVDFPYEKPSCEMIMNHGPILAKQVIHKNLSTRRKMINLFKSTIEEEIA